MKNRIYIDSLTWLRGIAALLVILFHVKRATNVSYTGKDEISNSFLIELMDIGDFGVLLFFVLSGATLYLNNRDFKSIQDIGRFYTKRFF